MSQVRRNCGGIDRDHQVVVGRNMMAYLYQFTGRHSELRRCSADEHNSERDQSLLEHFVIPPFDL
jgi:hypothetical protein